MDETAVRRALARITHEVIERNKGVENLCLLGIKRRGVPLANMLAENIERFEGVRVPVGALDITPHRDDMPEEAKRGVENECHVPFDIRDKRVVIVDDVLHTGRTVRAAIEAAFSLIITVSLSWIFSSAKASIANNKVITFVTEAGDAA